MNRRRPDIRTRVLRWLLALVALAGAGVLQGGHCLTHTTPAVTTMTVAGPAAHPSTAESGGHDHRHHADSSVAPHTHTTADDCHLEPAPGTPATITSTTVPPPTTAIRTSAVDVPVPVRRPRLPVTVALTEIGISRI